MLLFSTGGEVVDTARVKTSFATPSPDPLRLVKAPAACHPLPQGEEGENRNKRRGSAPAFSCHREKSRLCLPAR